jgi:hypothetical protein
MGRTPPQEYNFRELALSADTDFQAAIGFKA